MKKSTMTAEEMHAISLLHAQLETEGKLRFGKRSGEATTSGGAEFVIPVSGGLNKNSLVIATLQDHHPGVHVESASVLDAGRSTIVVRLNQAVPEPTREERVAFLGWCAAALAIGFWPIPVGIGLWWWLA